MEKWSGVMQTTKADGFVVGATGLFKDLDWDGSLVRILQGTIVSLVPGQASLCATIRTQQGTLELMRLLPYKPQNIRRE